MVGGGAVETVDPVNGGTQASPWHVGADLRVNEGTLSIRNGGFVQSVRGQVGYNGGTTGNAYISGASSRWQMLSHFSAGYFGTGIVIVSDGGLIESTQGDIGIEAGSQGTVTITGANSSWTTSGYVVIGYAGTGRLEVLEGGSVSNTDAYIGAWNGGFGAVTVSGEDSYWFSSGILRVARDWYGELTVADGGTVEADGGLIIADLAGSDGTLVIGAAAGGSADAPGVLIADTVAFGSGTGRMVFNHTGETYSFDAAISGTGSIDHWSGRTSFTADSSTFGGTTHIHGGGYLFVNGMLGGSTTVDGALGGTGSVAAVSIGATGRLIPGNSIGKLTILGNLAFADGAVYEIEINDGGDTAGVNNDFTYVGGTLTIGNGVSVSVLPANGTDDGSSYTPGTVYTILTADGGIAGTFALVKTKMAFLNPELSYDANNVYLELALNGGGGDGGVGFGDVADTPNQKGVAGALENFGPGNPLYDEIILMTEEEARAAYDALTGEGYASAATSQYMTADQIRQHLLDRLAALFGSGAGGIAALTGAPAAGDAVPGGVAVWGQAFGSRGSTDADTFAAAIDRNIYGFIGGADREIAPGLRAGVAAGYSRSSYDVSARSSSGDSDNFHLAAYAGTKLGDIGLKGILSYGYGRTDASRTVIVGGLTNNLSASYDTHTFQAAAEVGYDIALGGATLTPFAGLAGVHVETGSFTETGGPAALSFASSENTTGISALGLSAIREWGGVALAGWAAWRHAFGDTDPASRAAFASAPASPFTVRGVPIAENALALDAAIGAKLGEGTTLTLGYAGELAADARDHGLRAEIRVAF